MRLRRGLGWGGHDIGLGEKGEGERDLGGVTKERDMSNVTCRTELEDLVTN